jgi:hypothetical protein
MRGRKLRAIYRLNRQRFRHLRPAFVSMVRFLLRKEPAVIGTGLLFTVGLSMIYGDDFIAGIVALSLAALWGIAAWLLSKGLEEQRPKELTKLKYARIETYKREKRRYLFWKFSIPTVILTVWALGALFAIHKRDSKEEEDVLRSLTASVVPPPSGNVLLTVFSFTNHGGADIGKRQIICNDHLIVGNEGQSTIRGLGSEMTHEEYFPVHSGGDVTSDPCLLPLHSYLDPNRIECADVELLMEYVLVDQPKTMKRKSFRFLGRKFGTAFSWIQISVSEPGSECEPYVKQPIPSP